MKRKIVLTVLVLLISLPVVHADEPYEDRPGRFKERVITLRNWKLMEEFNLTGVEAQRVFDILKGFDDRREDLILKRRGLIKELRHEVRQPVPSEDRLKSLIAGLGDVNVELARLPRLEAEGLREVFSTKDIARYILFSERFAAEMKASIHGEISGWKREIKRR